ncbi:MAG TPA: hypothetical protein VJ123_06325 [Anaerolineales bacterium]|nr:hypothetical protein [Anaerolineales bacterium]
MTTPLLRTLVSIPGPGLLVLGALVGVLVLLCGSMLVQAILAAVSVSRVEHVVSDWRSMEKRVDINEADGGLLRRRSDLSGLAEASPRAPRRFVGAAEAAEMVGPEEVES